MTDTRQADDVGAPNPRVGMLAILRKRRGVINTVREFDGELGRLHLVGIDYKDDQRPEKEELMWELEPSRLVLEPTELPPSSSPPMPGEDFDSLLRAARWTAINPYLDPDAAGPLDRLIRRREIWRFSWGQNQFRTRKLLTPEK